MKKIVLSGKGGAGKTTVAAILTKQLAQKDKKLRVLVVDADEAVTLPIALQLEEEVKDLRPLGELTSQSEDKEEVLELIKKGYIKSIESDDIKFDFAYMGHHKMNSCLCGYNSSLYLFLELAREKDMYDYAIIDREAGLEHLTRSVYSMQDDYLILVSWLSPDYLSVIERINDVADVLGSTKNRMIVINNILDNASDEKIDASLRKLKLEGLKYATLPRITEPETVSEADEALIEALKKFVQLD